MTPLAAYHQALEHGCQFEVDDSGSVKMEGKIPAPVAESLRQNRQAIRKLVRFPMLVVQSGLSGESGIDYWVPDHAQRHALIDLGADPGDVFSRDEIAELVYHAKQGDDVSLLANAKQVFSGTILPQAREGHCPPWRCTYDPFSGSSPWADSLPVCIWSLLDPPEPD